MEAIKEKIHELVDKINDENQLNAYYTILNNINNQKGGKLFEKLSESQKNNLMLSYYQSFDKTKLTPHSEMKKVYQKWLTK